MRIQQTLQENTVDHGLLVYSTFTSSHEASKFAPLFTAMQCTQDQGLYDSRLLGIGSSNLSVPSVTFESG